MTEREYVLVERDRWERVQEAARLWQQHWGQMWEGRRDVMREAGLEWGDLDPVQPVTLSGADRGALARDICLIYDELDSGDPPPEGWCDKMHPQDWPYLLVDRLLTRWHIVRRTPEPGA